MAGRTNKRSRLRVLALGIVLVGSVIGVTYAVLSQDARNHHLIAALQANDTKRALALLDQGADPNVRLSPESSVKGRTGILEIIRLWLRRDSRARGVSALLLAARNNNTTVVKALLAKGASDLNGHCEKTDPDCPEMTPLLLAAHFTNIEMLQALLENGANPNVAGHDGETPLMLAQTPDVARRLLARGANVNAKDRYGTTVLIHAAPDEVETLRLLLDSGAQLNAANGSGVTVLMTAAFDGNIDNVRLLLQRGANVNATDSQGKTALQFARQSQEENDDADLIALLKQAGGK